MPASAGCPEHVARFIGCHGRQVKCDVIVNRETTVTPSFEKHKFSPALIILLSASVQGVAWLDYDDCRLLAVASGQILTSFSVFGVRPIWIQFHQGKLE